MMTLSGGRDVTEGETQNDSQLLLASPPGHLISMLIYWILIHTETVVRFPDLELWMIDDLDYPGGRGRADGAMWRPRRPRGGQSFLGVDVVGEPCGDYRSRRGRRIRCKCCNVGRNINIIIILKSPLIVQYIQNCHRKEADCHDSNKAQDRALDPTVPKYGSFSSVSF